MKLTIEKACDLLMYSVLAFWVFMLTSTVREQRGYIEQLQLAVIALMDKSIAESKAKPQEEAPFYYEPNRSTEEGT